MVSSEINSPLIDSHRKTSRLPLSDIGTQSLLDKFPSAAFFLSLLKGWPILTS